jgi:citrate synthase
MRKIDRLRLYAQQKEQMVRESDAIPDELFKEHNVNRGLRDINGKGVVTGLTGISEVTSMKVIDGKRVPCEGELWYRGYRIEDLVQYYSEHGFGYENLAYLLLFGKRPDEEEEKNFIENLALSRSLPSNFTRDVIMKAPTKDIMNSMTRSILTLASYDAESQNISVDNVIRQSMMLIAVFPMLAIYAYHAYNYDQLQSSMYIHRPKSGISTAENILRMLRPDKKYTKTEVKVLDAALMLHMEHGGGNNSTFTTRVVTSSGSDTYAAIAAAMSSLKGPRHGGANLKVMEMMEDIKNNVGDWKDDDAVCSYLTKLVDGEAFDRKGLIYGMGHAVYSISDPRERIFKRFVTTLAEEKNKMKELELYNQVEKLAPRVIAEKRHIYKGVSPNVDFYSGFVYSMLGIPKELFTPLFAIARISGWSAHRLEEIVENGRIMRPAYISVMNEIGESEGE